MSDDETPGTSNRSRTLFDTEPEAAEETCEDIPGDPVVPDITEEAAEETCEDIPGDPVVPDITEEAAEETCEDIPGDPVVPDITEEAAEETCEDIPGDPVVPDITEEAAEETCEYIPGDPVVPDITEEAAEETCEYIPGDPVVPDITEEAAEETCEYIPGDPVVPDITEEAAEETCEYIPGDPVVPDITEEAAEETCEYIPGDPVVPDITEEAAEETCEDIPGDPVVPDITEEAAEETCEDIPGDPVVPDITEEAAEETCEYIPGDPVVPDITEEAAEETCEYIPGDPVVPDITEEAAEETCEYIPGDPVVPDITDGQLISEEKLREILLDISKTYGLKSFKPLVDGRPLSTKRVKKHATVILSTDDIGVVVETFARELWLEMDPRHQCDVMKYALDKGYMRYRETPAADYNRGFEMFKEEKPKIPKRFRKKDPSTTLTDAQIYACKWSDLQITERQTYMTNARNVRLAAAKTAGIRSKKNSFNSGYRIFMNECFSKLKEYGLESDGSQPQAWHDLGPEGQAPYNEMADAFYFPEFREAEKNHDAAELKKLSRHYRPFFVFFGDRRDYLIDRHPELDDLQLVKKAYKRFKKLPAGEIDILQERGDELQKYYGVKKRKSPKKLMAKRKSPVDRLAKKAAFRRIPVELMPFYPPRNLLGTLKELTAVRGSKVEKEHRAKYDRCRARFTLEADKYLAQMGPDREDERAALQERLHMMHNYYRPSLLHLVDQDGRYVDTDLAATSTTSEPNVPRKRKAPQLQGMDEHDVCQFFQGSSQGEL